MKLLKLLKKEKVSYGTYRTRYIFFFIPAIIENKLYWSTKKKVLQIYKKRWISIKILSEVERLKEKK